MSDATRTPARNAAQHPCQLTPIGVNSENTLAQFTLIRRNRRSSSGFSRNLRQEVSKQDKSYFWDLGVRNVAIDNLKPLTERDDVGALGELRPCRAPEVAALSPDAGQPLLLAHVYRRRDRHRRGARGRDLRLRVQVEPAAPAASPNRFWPPTQARRSRSSLGRATGRIWAHNRRCPKYRLGREPAAEMAAGVRRRVNGVL